VKGPDRIETARLVLRRPRPSDAEAILSRYAGDPDATRYMSWPTQRSVEQTRAFLAHTEAEWESWPAGAYLIEARSGGALLGGTGLHFENPVRAQTGYILARDAWGVGHATEALRAIVALAAQLGVLRLQALCHLDHSASQRVLEKGGFAREGVLRRHTAFPNLGSDRPVDVLCYARIFG
jgi:RimJ/RimL family protein N-acetyltransferase